MNVYEFQGYKDRFDYLAKLAENNDVLLSHVLALADLLGPAEDFDGLVTAIEDTMISNDISFD